MSTDDHRAAGWTDEALDRLRDALKAMPAEKNEQANPSKEEPRG
ncbi:hypothetical protein [Promicromonospora iranensis]|uniref:Uncharacterized protein n=1 Tax=Promicromonospora iranensis TaxID=1105144 RepID=A0ABU2CV74_9MICO|nr:hypothetical protein [Promicromonospora iranensis]MDR7385242.1 hypothetical protein [Promicromonospora iranensis]